MLVLVVVFMVFLVCVVNDRAVSLYTYIYMYTLIDVCFSHIAFTDYVFLVLFLFCLSVCPSVRLSVCPSVRLSVRLSVCPSVRLSVVCSVVSYLFVPFA